MGLRWCPFRHIKTPSSLYRSFNFGTLLILRSLLIFERLLSISVLIFSWLLDPALHKAESLLLSSRSCQVHTREGLIVSVEKSQFWPTISGGLHRDLRLQLYVVSVVVCHGPSSWLDLRLRLLAFLPALMADLWCFLSTIYELCMSIWYFVTVGTESTLNVSEFYVEM